MVRKNRSTFYPLVRSYGPQVSGPHFTHALGIAGRYRYPYSL